MVVPENAFAAVHGKYETAYISNSDTDHANMSLSQTSYRNVPQTKSKLESELQQNPPDLKPFFTSMYSILYGL
jgi:hypothetical protein